MQIERAKHQMTLIAVIETDKAKEIKLVIWMRFN